MPKFVARATSAAAPEALWPLVSDLTRHGEWAADPVTVTRRGDGTYESVARAKGREFRARLEVIESVAPRRFAFRAVDETGTYEHVLTLVPDGAGTAIAREVTATRLSPGQRALYWVALVPVRKPSATKALEKLAALAR